MRESTLERHLVQHIRTIGGLCLKFVSPGYAGVPDRVVLLPGGEVVWVELKTPEGVVSPVQRRMHAKLRHLVQRVEIVRTDADIRRVFPVEDV